MRLSIDAGPGAECAIYIVPFYFLYTMHRFKFQGSILRQTVVLAAASGRYVRTKSLLNKSLSNFSISVHKIIRKSHIIREATLSPNTI